MTDLGGDPLVSSIASVLKVPLVELYALLWRVGVVEIRHSDRTAHRSSRMSRVVSGPVCPDPAVHGSEFLSRWSPPPRLPGPEPTRQGRSAYSRAVG
ncbi:Rv1535 domain-containing protein [Mycobacterium interjectum]|uniref:Rv1535 domain-containing protein n=1 Tax=Mycobacterium interjectum TaxID=33895 RepID=UPI000BDF10D4|nr:Rv1535 domain-containing protein [Mycobacterium interjectum]